MPRVRNSRVSTDGSGTIVYSEAPDNSTFVESTTTTYEPTRGERGPQGIPGVPGADGQDGQDGAPGAPGEPGADGLSAYELAVQEGYDGNLASWLASLQGADGQDGVDGEEGPQGASAYEVAVLNGFQGTIQEWLDSLKGADGIDGQDGQDGAPGAPGGSPSDFLWFSMIESINLNNEGYVALPFTQLAYSSPFDGSILDHPTGKNAYGNEEFPAVFKFIPSTSGLYQVEFELNLDVTYSGYSSVLIKFQVDSKSNVGPLGSTHNHSYHVPVFAEDVYGSQYTSSTNFMMPMIAGQEYDFMATLKQPSQVTITTGSGVKIRKIADSTPLPNANVDISPVTFNAQMQWLDNMTDFGTPNTLSIYLYPDIVWTLVQQGNGSSGYKARLTAPQISGPEYTCEYHMDYAGASTQVTNYQLLDYNNVNGSSGFMFSLDSLPEGVSHITMLITEESPYKEIFQVDLPLPPVEQRFNDMLWEITIDRSTLVWTATAVWVEQF